MPPLLAENIAGALKRSLLRVLVYLIMACADVEVGQLFHAYARVCKKDVV